MGEDYYRAPSANRRPETGLEVESDRSGNTPGAASAANPSRRIYVGNLLYSVTPLEIGSMLEENGFATYDKIHLSVDPVSGRNPGYCFVEFFVADTAERALQTLSGVLIRDRPIKVGPCQPKRENPPGMGSGSGSGSGSQPVFQRWGDWREEEEPRARAERWQGPHGATERFEKYSRETHSSEPGKRVYVGGLGRMVNQEQGEDEMRELLGDLNYETIGKRITPHESTRAKPGNHHFCFVGMATAEDALKAVEVLNGKVYNGTRLRVSVASPMHKQQQQQQRTERQQRPEQERRTEQQRSDQAAKNQKVPRAMESSNWRVRAN